MTICVCTFYCVIIIRLIFLNDLILSSFYNIFIIYGFANIKWETFQKRKKKKNGEKNIMIWPLNIIILMFIYIYVYVICKYIN